MSWKMGPPTTRKTMRATSHGGMELPLPLPLDALLPALPPFSFPSADACREGGRGKGGREGETGGGG
jgi:hypothetical protein